MSSSSNFEESSFDSSDNSEDDKFSDIFPSYSDCENSDTENNSVPEYEWRNTKEPGDCTPPPFDVFPGIKVNCGSNLPLEMFEILFNDSLSNLILTETNKTGNYLPDSLKLKYDWREITPNEMKIMAATLIAQQLNYDIFQHRHPGYNDNRIALIYKLLTFTHDPTVPDPLLKAKPMIDLVRHRFKEVYTPRQNLIIDERITSMSKLVKCSHSNGLCSYVLSESISGYIINFILHITNCSLDRPAGYKKEVIYSLMGGLFFKGYHIYTMNYHNSLELALDMHEKKTGFVGSMRPKIRNIPKELVAEPLQMNKHAYRYEKSGRMMVMKYNFKRNAYLVSTVHHGDEMTEAVIKKTTIVVPKLIDDYESADKNVLFEDFYLETFHFEKSEFGVTEHKIFRHVLNLLVSNAYALHKINGGTLKFSKFKYVLCNALIEKYL